MPSPVSTLAAPTPTTGTRPVAPAATDPKAEIGPRPWLTGLAFAAAVVAPIINAVGAVHRGWVPYGDEAIIGTRAFDVGTKLTPLVGMPSTFSAVSHYNPSQPGPLQFWALAPFVRVLGMSAGVLIGTAVINAAALGVAGWVLWRRTGRAAALLGMAAGLYATLYVVVPTFSFEPVNSIAPLLPLVTTLVLAWAVADGELIWLPLLVLFGSFAAQGDLEFVGVVVIAVLWALAAAAVRAFRTRERGARRGGVIGWSVVLLLACWSGPIYEAARHDGGNLREIVDAFFAPAKLLGLGGAGRALGAVLDIPPYLLQNSSQAAWSRGLDGTAAVTLGLLVALYWLCRRRGARTARTLIVAAAVATLAAAANGYRLPVQTFQPGHTVFVRGVGVFVWLAITVAAFEVLRRLPWRRPLPALTSMLAVAVVIEPAWASLGALLHDWPRGHARFALAAATLAACTAVAAAVLGLARLRNVDGSPSPAAGGEHGTDREPIPAGSARTALRQPRTWARSLPDPVQAGAAAAAVAVLVAAVAWFPNLSTSYFAWAYTATPALTSQVMANLPPVTTDRKGVLVASGGGEGYLTIAKALLAQLRQRHVVVLTGADLDSTYGAGRSYPANVKATRGELLVLPDYATILPPGARPVAHWVPPGWDAHASAALQAAIVAYVARVGGLRLTAEGASRVDETLAFAVPGTDGSGRPDPAVYAADPMALLPHPAALTALYQSGWVASPALPPEMETEVDALNEHGTAITVWYVPAPLAPGAGTKD